MKGRMKNFKQKDNTLFQTALRHYEQKEYKKGLRAIDQLLERHPDHADSMALKGLMLRFLDRKDEALTLVRKGLTCDLSSAICWHVYGILHRVDRKFLEALKCYLSSARIDPRNVQVLKDLVVFHIYFRNWDALEKLQMDLISKADTPNNLTVLAFAAYMNGQYERAFKVLKSRSEIMKDFFNEKNQENSEFFSFYIRTLCQHGSFTDALEVLKSSEKWILDKTFYYEHLVTCLLETGNLAEAEKYNHVLLERNPDRMAYFKNTERLKNIDVNGSAEAREEAIKHYQALAQKYPSSLIAKTYPFQFCLPEQFTELAMPFILKNVAKRMPNIHKFFLDLPLDPVKLSILKQVTEDLLQESLKDDARSEDSLWILNLLAHIYDSEGLYSQAEDYVNQALNIKEACSDLMELKARILKHQHRYNEAAGLMEETRKLDPKDRGINTKAALYYLNIGDNERAENLMSMFTRNEAIGGCIGDLVDMQCCFYLYKDGLAYLAKKDIPKALERFRYVAKIYEDWTEDHFDFISHSMTTGTFNDLKDLVDWEDKKNHDVLLMNACIHGTQIYLDLLKNPELSNQIEKEQTEEKQVAKENAEKEVEQQEVKGKEEILAHESNGTMQPTSAGKAYNNSDHATTNGHKNPKGSKESHKESGESTENSEVAKAPIMPPSINRFSGTALVLEDPLSQLDIFVKPLENFSDYQKVSEYASENAICLKDASCFAIFNANLVKKNFKACKSFIKRLSEGDLRRYVCIAQLENKLGESSGLLKEKEDLQSIAEELADKNDIRNILIENEIQEQLILSADSNLQKDLRSVKSLLRIFDFPEVLDGQISKAFKIIQNIGSQEQVAKFKALALEKYPRDSRFQ